MKKALLATIAFLSTLSLIACSNNQSTESSSRPESQSEQSSSSSASTNNVDVNAAVKNLEYLKDTPTSKKTVIEFLTSEFEYSEEVAEEAIKQAGIDFKENAYKTAKQLNEFGISADKIKESLTSEEDGGGYTESEVNYAIEKLEKELAEEKSKPPV